MKPELLFLSHVVLQFTNLSKIMSVAHDKSFPLLSPLRSVANLSQIPVIPGNFNPEIEGKGRGCGFITVKCYQVWESRIDKFEQNIKTKKYLITKP